jgi:hypothetical protein
MLDDLLLKAKASYSRDLVMRVRQQRNVLSLEISQ